MNIRAFIIDDERKAISIIRNKLERLATNIEITGEFQDPEMALQALGKEKPNLIFLDISMPKMNGFEFLKNIDNPTFEVIFVTAYGDFAIDAIRHCAIGYILKPIIDSDLQLAIENAQKNIEQKTALQKNKQLIENLSFAHNRNKKIAIPSAKGLDFIEVQNIIHCEGLNGYTVMHLMNRDEIISSYSIGYFGKMLENMNFFLTHKSHLINLDYLESYDRNGIAELKFNHSIPVARNRREEFLERIERL